jgi:hypothetical protein
MNIATIDPSNCVEVTSVCAKKFANGLTQDLNDADKIDIGRYEHVMVLASCSDVGTAITVTVTPKEADGRATAEFPLDGTNGAPNYVMTFTSGALGTAWAAFPTSGRRRYLQIQCTTAGGTGTASLSVTVLGFMRTSEAVLRPFTRTGVANTGIS